jgi:hypothetical protein
MVLSTRHHSAILAETWFHPHQHLADVHPQVLGIKRQELQRYSKVVMSTLAALEDIDAQLVDPPPPHSPRAPVALCVSLLTVVHLWHTHWAQPNGSGRGSKEEEDNRV